MRNGQDVSHGGGCDSGGCSGCILTCKDSCDSWSDGNLSYFYGGSGSSGTSYVYGSGTSGSATVSYGTTTTTVSKNGVGIFKSGTLHKSTQIKMRNGNAFSNLIN